MSTVHVYGDHTYSVGASSDWEGAVSNAEKSGGYLAIITSATENDFIFDFASAYLSTAPSASDGGGAKYVWLGGSDIAAEGAWQWLDGNSLSGFSNWGSGIRGKEPDDYQGRQDAMAMGLESWPKPAGGIGTSGRWNDLDKANSLYYVVEWSIPTAFDTDDVVYGSPIADTLYGRGGNDGIFGYAGNDAINGGNGIDTVYYSAAAARYVVSPLVGAWSVRDTSGSEGADIVSDVERLHFSDRNLAIDIDGNAGTTAKILGAVFGATSVDNLRYVGIGLDLLDSGSSYESVMQLALDVQLGPGADHQALVNLLYTNVIGNAPPPDALAHFTSLLDSGAFTPASLGVLAADTPQNAGNINLVGLHESGIAFV